MNQTLQMKPLWKILAEPNNLWDKIVTEKYLKTDNILNYKKKRNTSWQWSKLMGLRDLFLSGLIWQVGDVKPSVSGKITGSGMALSNQKLEVRLTLIGRNESNRTYERTTHGK